MNLMVIRNNNKILISTVESTISTFILVSLLLATLLTAMASAKTVYVRDTQVNVRWGPGTEFKIISKAKKGQKFEVVDETRNWVKIKLSDRVEGWIYKNLVEYPQNDKLEQEPKDNVSIPPTVAEKAEKEKEHHIALFPFGNDTDDSTAGNTASETVLREILNSKPSNITIIEREELKKILEEQKLSINGFIDYRTTIPAGMIKGVDVVILGKVLNLQVETTTSREEGTKRYQSGIERVVNPEYTRLQQKIEQREKEIEDFDNWITQQCRLTGRPPTPAQREYMRGLRNDLARLQSELYYSTPQYINMPIWSIWHYAIIRYEKVAFCKISYRIIDTVNGEILKSNVVEKQAYDSDKMVENSNPEIGIYSDSLQLRSDGEMRNQVLDLALKKVSDEISHFLKELY